MSRADELVKEYNEDKANAKKDIAKFLLQKTDYAIEELQVEVKDATSFITDKQEEIKMLEELKGTVITKYDDDSLDAEFFIEAIDALGVDYTVNEENE